MIANPSRTNAAFQESVDLLLHLHKLTMAGKDDSEEADEVREKMDAPWYEMTEAEQRKIRGLSADLYTIGMTRQVSRINSDLKFAEEMRELTEKDAWDEILNRIRERESTLAPRDVAYARGLCWAHLGKPNVAIEFLREAARLRPLKASEEILLLTCYAHAGRGREVLARAQEIRASEQHPLLLFKAAEVLSMTAEESSEAGTEHRRAAIDCTERGFSALQGVQIDPGNQAEFDALAVPALFHLALNYDQLGDHQKAVEVCRRALEMAPENPDALMLYGFLTFDEFPNTQRRQFIGTQRSQFVEESYDRLLSATGFAPRLN